MYHVTDDDNGSRPMLELIKLAPAFAKGMKGERCIGVVCKVLNEWHLSWDTIRQILKYSG